MHKIKLTFLFIWAIVVLNACKDQPELKKVSKVTVDMHHVFGSTNTPFVLNSTYYHTSTFDTFKPTTLIYHINSFELSNDNKDVLTFDNSFAMVDLSEGQGDKVLNRTFSTDKTYTKISFTIGVMDSAVNASGKLNTLFTAPMYWGMTNGYIHFKLEGLVKKESNNSVILHVGGYKVPYNLAQRVTLTLKNPIQLTTAENHVKIQVDMAKYFDGINKIDLKEINEIHQPNDKAKLISANWPGMFSVE